MPQLNPTTRTYHGLSDAYDFFNTRLFGGTLEEPTVGPTATIRPQQKLHKGGLRRFQPSAARASSA
jgi:hypothetical protein